jgi:hypothetical protein
MDDGGNRVQSNYSHKKKTSLGKSIIEKRMMIAKAYHYHLKRETAIFTSTDEGV